MTQGQVLLFRAGGLRLGVFLAEVGRLLVEDRLTAVPFAHPAMAGLLVADADGPVPVFDLAALTKKTTTEATRTRTVALFPTSKGPVGLRLEELLGTVASYEGLDATATAALHENVDAALLKTITGAAKTPELAFSFFSPDAFLAGLGL
jgi:chemotaxis signal transduction protein